MSAAAELPLRDIHLPAAPDWWPPAPGWWLLGVLLLLLLAWCGRALLRYWRLRRRRSRVLRAFDVIAGSCPESGRDAAATLAAASEYLRRSVLPAAPEAATLRSNAWLEFLDGDDPSKPFSSGDGQIFADGPFQRELDPDLVQRACALARVRLRRALR